MLIIFRVKIFTFETAVITYLCNAAEINIIYFVYLLFFEVQEM